MFLFYIKAQFQSTYATGPSRHEAVVLAIIFAISNSIVCSCYTYWHSKNVLDWLLSISTDDCITSGRITHPKSLFTYPNDRITTADYQDVSFRWV